ncbi:MAG: ABC transporter substrate-binding protein [Betaproteobacteria bacterium]|nr:ABC transporter substrate-binding protein [Betaproteobacteria bacterium]
MSRLQLSYAGHLSDRVQDLYYGKVRPEAIDLQFLPLQPFQAFKRLLAGEFHCGEMSFSTWVIRTAQAKAGGKALPFVAVPAFPSRTFRHNAIYVNRKAGIMRPEDLKGRRVGVPEYQMTAAVWARGMLQHEYGVQPSDLHWVTGGVTDPGRKPMMEVTLPGIDIRHEDRTSLNDMLTGGDIDALIAPQLHPGVRDGLPEVGYLFPDPAAAARAYYAKTGLFPIMHVVVLRRDVYEQHPWTAVNLYQAFCEAKDNALRRLEVEEPPPVSLPWLYEYSQSIRALMGRDYWPYGIEPNRKVIDALCDYTAEQGLVPERVQVEELFAPTIMAQSELRL